MRYPLLLSALTLSLVAPAGAGWLDQLQRQLLGDGDRPAATVAALSDGEIVDGLRAALEQGTARAVELLGRPDGFLANPKVRVPLPPSIESVAKGLRQFGQGQYVDAFETTMNRAAEAAVPETREIFVEAVRGMTLEDARGILQGPDDAATRYFRERTGERLRERITPIVSRATDGAGATASYKELSSHLGVLHGLVDSRALDLDAYVTDKALDGLFLMIAEEERRIRENPVARSTELLKRVFAGAGG